MVDGPRRALRVAIVVGALLLSSCGTETGANSTATTAIPTTVPVTTAGTFEVTSPAFAEGDAVPVQYTCEGSSTSPPLQWGGVPAETAELAVVVDDPNAPGGTFVHWILFNLEPTLTALEEGKAPKTAKTARGDSGNAAYYGPCPPVGETHTYRFRVHALRPGVAAANGASGEDVLKSIEAYTIAKGELLATFQRL